MRHYDYPDANAAPIWAYLEARGCKLLKVEGCDRLVLIPGGGMVLVEVKNPNGKARAKGGGWAYTKAEQTLMAWCAENGHEYLTVTSVEEMAMYLAGVELSRRWKSIGVSAGPGA